MYLTAQETNTNLYLGVGINLNSRGMRKHIPILHESFITQTFVRKQYQVMRYDNISSASLSRIK